MIIQRMGNRKKWKRTLPVLLAALLWAEGTLGTVCASEPALRELSAEIEKPEDGDGSASVRGEGTAPEEPEKAAGEEVSAPGGTGKPTVGENPAPEESENPAAGEEPEPEEPENPSAGEEPAPEEPENPPTGEEPAPEEPENPPTGEEPAPEEPENPPAGEEPAPEEPENPPAGEEPAPEPENPAEEEEPDVSGEEPTVSENTISENTAEEVPEDWSGEPTVGEPPLMTEAEGGYGTYSYDGVSSRTAGSRHQTPGVGEIIDRYEAYPWNLDVPNSYSVEPSVKAPYLAGHLTDNSLENARNLLNFIRYVAGVPADVTLNEDYTEKAQAGALLNRVNGKLDHKPEKPEGFPEELYQTGYEGCSKGNLAAGSNYSNIAKSLLNGWMFDGDASNITTMGHRRWVLNPSMTQTGFGAVDSYSAMYALDSKGSGITDYVAWPAQNMPIELMNGSGTPWTLSLGSDYGKANFQDVNVTLKDITNNKSWNFSGSNANGAFKVNIEAYGMKNCIIFRPNSISYSKDSQFRVTVTGIKDKDGNAAPINYNVDFFSLEEKPAEVSEIILNRDTLHLLKGVEGKQEETLLVTVKPGNARDKKLVWKSKDESVATVDATGKVMAVGVGTTEISATATNGVQGVCTVKVSDYSLQSDAAGFSFDEETKTYSLSFDLTMNAAPGRLTVMDGDPEGTGGAATDTITWICENESVAAVDVDGNVTPLSVGETLVWADVDDGLAVLKCTVKVEDSKLPQIELREQAYTLTIRRDAAGNPQGESRQLRLYFTPPDSNFVNEEPNFVKWTSADPTVAAFRTDDTPGTEEEPGTDVGTEEGPGTKTGQGTVAETISGNTVTVTAVGAGETKISAVIVNEKGQPVADSDGKRAETSCTVTVRAEAVPADDAMPRPVALTNIQSTLRDVELPEGWSWEEPDTALAQFTGGKTKKFAAHYLPADAGENVLPARRFLEVYFLTVENISMDVRTGEGKEAENATLAIGQNAKCYVNYSFAEALEQLGEKDEYKNNQWFKEQKKDILKILSDATTWSNSNVNAVSVEETADGVKLTAKSAGSATVKASLRLGRKTFNASVKFTVKEADGTLTVKRVEHFTHVSGTGGADRAVDKYTGLLSDFQTQKAGQVNSKIVVTLSGATRVTAKSGNAKVVAVKSAAAEEDGFVVSLIVKAAGTAEITLTGNDAAKTSKTICLAVGDAEPGLSAESITVNLMQTPAKGEEISLYPAKRPEGAERYEITYVTMGSDEKSAKFTLTPGTLKNRYIIKAKSGTKTGTYKVKIRAAAGGKTHELPLTVKVVSKNPVYKVKQARKLNLFYKNDESLLQVETDEILTRMECTGLADYSVERDEENGCYYIRAKDSATINSVKKGKLTLHFSGWQGSYTTSFTAGVEKKAPKIMWDTTSVTLYPKAGIQRLYIGIRNPGTVFWDSVKAEKTSGAGKGNYTVEVDREKGGLVLSGKNLNQVDSFSMQIRLSDTKNWAQGETVTYTPRVKVNMGQPAIALENRTLQLNANGAFKGYDAASTAVKWKDGGVVTTDQGVRVSVYCDPKDAKAKALVEGSSVVFSVGKDNGCYQVKACLNNKTVAKGTYKYMVQAAKDGKIWKTPLTLKVVDTEPEMAVKLTAKGSIDVLNREGSYMTLTPSLKAVGGAFLIPESREVRLTGRDAHLFRAVWSADGSTIELRAREKETLVTKYQYTVTPLLTLRNVNGETEEVKAPAVKFKVKQGSVKVTALPKTALMYSGAYNSVEIDMNAVLKGAPAPEIERVVLSGNTDAFTYVYNKDGEGTLTMRDTGRAVKGKTYSLKLQVYFTEQADNGKPVTVRYKVKVK